MGMSGMIREGLRGKRPRLGDTDLEVLVQEDEAYVEQDGGGEGGSEKPDCEPRCPRAGGERSRPDQGERASSPRARPRRRAAAAAAWEVGL